MMKLGVIRPSKSECSSPLHLVGKIPNTWRACGGYRALNSVTKPDRYPVPQLQDITTIAQNKLDLIRAYHQIPVVLDLILKTSITASFVMFEFLWVPLGLRNASQTFQRFIDLVLRDLSFVCGCIDDVFIASKNMQNYIYHVKQVFERLKQSDVVIN